MRPYLLRSFSHGDDDGDAHDKDDYDDKYDEYDDNHDHEYDDEWCWCEITKPEPPRATFLRWLFLMTWAPTFSISYDDDYDDDSNDNHDDDDNNDYDDNDDDDDDADQEWQIRGWL